MTVTGGLAWWNDFVVVACYNFIDHQEQVRRKHHSCHHCLSRILLFHTICHDFRCIRVVNDVPPLVPLLTLVEALSTLIKPGQRLCLGH